MATYIEKITGFEQGGFNLSSRGNQIIIEEVVRVIAKGQLDTGVQIVSDLPVVGFPGLTAFNPCGLTFTLNQSRHPDNVRYILESVNGMNREDESRAWLISLTYAEPLPITISFSPETNRKDQKVTRPDAVDPEDEEAIIDPTDRPPVFSRGTKTFVRASRKDLQNRVIRHTNRLPIRDAIPIQVANTTYTWSWYINASAYREKELRNLEGKTNSDEVIITGAGAVTRHAEGTVKCTSITAAEEWEAPSGSSTTFHTVKITASFEVIDNDTEDTWLSPWVSMHTKYRDLTTGGLVPIEINAAKAKATEPWPLKPDGTAIHYSDLDTAADADYGLLQVQTGFLTTEDAVPILDTPFQPFFSKYNLDFPQVRP